jgi:hypothetical protein
LQEVLGARENLLQLVNGGHCRHTVLPLKPPHTDFRLKVPEMRA